MLEDAGDILAAPFRHVAQGGGKLQGFGGLAVGVGAVAWIILGLIVWALVAWGSD